MTPKPSKTNFHHFFIVFPNFQIFPDGNFHPASSHPSFKEQFLNETPRRRCFMLRAATDHRGRKLGSVSDVEGSSALVRWPDAGGNLGPPVEVALDGKKGLLQVGKLTFLGCFWGIFEADVGSMMVKMRRMRICEI